MWRPHGLRARIAPALAGPTLPELANDKPAQRGARMSESVYKIITLVGTSKDSWEKAAMNAVQKVSKTLRDLRIAEVSELDMQIEDGKVVAYRAKVQVSYKYDGE